MWTIWYGSYNKSHIICCKIMQEMVYFRPIDWTIFELTLDKDKERISMEEKETETYTVILKIDIQSIWHIFGGSIGTILNIFEQKSGRYCSERLFPIVPVVFPTVLRKEIDILYLFVSSWLPRNHAILIWSYLIQGIEPTRRCWIIFKGNENGAGWKLLEQGSTIDNGWPWKLDQWVFFCFCQ